jgi:hypothetical protein
MLKRKPGIRTALLAGAVLLMGGVVADGAAADVFAWRTDDGGYAFTDDEKVIPPRYRDRVEVKRSASLASYGRYTPQDARAIDHYEKRLTARLERLRAFNAPPPAQPLAGRQASSQPERTRVIVTAINGRRDRGGVDVSVPIGDGDEPIVTGTVLVRPDGGAITQPAQIMRQGNRILSVSKSRPSEWNLSDAMSEEELAEKLREE